MKTKEEPTEPANQTIRRVWTGFLPGRPHLYFMAKAEHLDTCLELSRFQHLSVVIEGNHLMLIGRPEKGSSEMTFWATSDMGESAEQITSLVERTERIGFIMVGNKRHLFAEYAKDGHCLEAREMNELPGVVRAIEHTYL